MIKWLIRLVLGCLVLLVIAGVVFVYYINGIARSAVEYGGTYALGVETTLDSVDVGLWSGELELAGLSVANPEGFEAEHFFRLGKGHVVTEAGTLWEDRVVVPQVTLSGLSMNLEKKSGKANYAVIIDNLGRFESKEPASPGPEPSIPPAKSGKQYIVKKLIVENIEVQVELLPIGGSLTRVPVKIDRIELTDLGSGEGEGVKMDQLIAIVTKAVLSAVVGKAGDLPAEVLNELGKGLEGLGEIGTAATKVVGEVGNKVGQAVEGVGKEVGKGLEDAGKKLETGLGGLLEMGKKKESEGKP